MVRSNEEARKRLAQRHSCNGSWTHECCFEVDVFVCWGCIQDVECCFEVIYLYGGSGCRDRDYLYYDVYFVICLVF